MANEKLRKAVRLLFSITRHLRNRYSDRYICTNYMNYIVSKMRELIDKNNQGEKISAQEVLNEIYEFSEPIKTKRKDDHWFKVELLDVKHNNARCLFAFLLVLLMRIQVHGNMQAHTNGLYP